ncbi:MAG: hypothetical protein HY077_02570 [Elusimicrobia bacterium]|nr:hypothetical protein [Elusimicrobiota bacterium]
MGELVPRLYWGRMGEPPGHAVVHGAAARPPRAVQDRYKLEGGKGLVAWHDGTLAGFLHKEESAAWLRDEYLQYVARCWIGKGYPSEGDVQVDILKGNNTTGIVPLLVMSWSPGGDNVVRWLEKREPVFAPLFVGGFSVGGTIVDA